MRPAPDPPFNVQGTATATDTNKITWSWTFDPNKSDIIGFRVYRADASDGIFSLIPNADETILKPDAPKQFIDQVSPACGKAYYIVAVYQDVNGVAQESGASLNSWYSPPCS